MNRIRRLAVITTIATFLLISIGGFVRAAGAGLGCESWPKCFDWTWLPPLSQDDIPPGVDASRISIPKAWIEYINRLIGVIIGFLIVATWWVAFRHGRGRRDLFWPATAAAVLVAYQGWFGGQVVRQRLDPRLVSIHLFLALVIVALLIWITLRARDPAPRTVPLSIRPPGWRRFHHATLALLALASVQIVLGALVRGSIEVIGGEEAKLQVSGAERGAWLEQVGLLDQVHRKVALAILLTTAVLVLIARRAGLPRRLRALLAFNAGIVLLQIAAGLALAYRDLPPPAQLVHLTLGSWLIGGLFAQWILLRQEPATAAEEEGRGEAKHAVG